MLDVYVISDGMGDVALVQLRGVHGDAPIRRLKKHAALSLIQSRLRDPFEGPRLRSLAADLAGYPSLWTPMSDAAALAEFDKALSFPERLVAVPQHAQAPPAARRVPAAPRRAVQPVAAHAADLAVQRMTMEERFSEALDRAGPHVGPEMREELAALADPATLAMIGGLMAMSGGVFALAAAGSFVGVTQVLGFLLLASGWFFVGWQAIEATEKILALVTLLSTAKRDADLEEAGKLLADIVAVISVGTLVAVLTRMAARAGVRPKGGRKTTGDADGLPDEPSGSPKESPPRTPQTEVLPRLDRNSVKALADSFRHLPSKGKQASFEACRPGVVARLVDAGGNEITGRSKFDDTDMHPRLQSALDGVATRGPAHGRCAEINALNKALKSGKSIEGARIQTARVSGPNSPDHGRPWLPCPTCADVLREFRVTYVE